MDELEDKSPLTRERRRWEPPALKTVGNISGLLREGGGKLSPSAADPGEPRKPTPVA
jgi:hypothetical protein